MENSKILEALKKCETPPTPYDLYAMQFEASGVKYDDFCETLGGLEHDGIVVFTKKGKVMLGEANDMVRGTFRANMRGFGFVCPEDEAKDDIYIAGVNTMSAVNGDIVLCTLMKPSREGKGAEGRITRIVEHTVKTVIGTLLKFDVKVKNTNVRYYVHPDDRKINFDINVESSTGITADEGSKVEIELTQYPTAQLPAFGKITAVFGVGDSLEANYNAILHTNGISTEFPQEVINEAERVSQSPIVPDGRLDLRDKIILTIDSAEAKDLDDAVSVEKTADGYLLGVHIADVTEYVRENSAIDREAIDRGTSVYFTDRVVPMLPKSLSNGCCSLNGGVDRYALSALISLNDKGEITECRMAESIIRTSVRGVYTEINDIEEKGEGSEYYQKYSCLMPETFKNMFDLYNILDSKSRRNGALELETVEAKLILNDEGEVTDIVAVERGITERLIEQFMLTANEAVASWLFWQDMPCVYRIHEDPPTEKIQAFAIFAHNLGLDITSLNAKAIRPLSLQKIIAQSKEQGIATIVSYVLLRSLAKARYSATCSPHFGLAIEKYCHFTSPIRRYPDLSVHRIVKTILHGEMTPQRIEALTSFTEKSAEMSTENEMRAVRAERDIESLYKAIYMSKFVGEQFEGVISSVMSFGFFVELTNTCEGLVPIATLNGYFDYNERNMTLHCGRRTFSLGQKVKVTIEKVDVTARKIDMRLVEENAPSAPKPVPTYRR
ncbi:MAG: ribonuclease R [Eubacteriales bacterium]